MKSNVFSSLEDARKVFDRAQKYTDVAINLAKKVDRVANNHLENITFSVQNKLDEDGNKVYYVCAVGNWNNPDVYNKETQTREDTSNIVKRVEKILEQIGVELFWDDSTSFCGDCGKIIETQPDSYFWKPNYIEVEGEYICFECADADDYIDKVLLNQDNIHYQSRRLIDFEAYDFECVREFESYYSAESIKYELDKDEIKDFVLVKDKVLDSVCKVYVKVEEEEEEGSRS